VEGRDRLAVALAGPDAPERTPDTRLGRPDGEPVPERFAAAGLPDGHPPGCLPPVAENGRDGILPRLAALGVDQAVVFERRQRRSLEIIVPEDHPTAFVGVEDAVGLVEDEPGTRHPVQRGHRSRPLRRLDE